MEELSGDLWKLAKGIREIGRCEKDFWEVVDKVEEEKKLLDECWIIWNEDKMEVG